MSAAAPNFANRCLSAHGVRHCSSGPLREDVKYHLISSACAVERARNSDVIFAMPTNGQAVIKSCAGSELRLGRGAFIFGATSSPMLVDPSGSARVLFASMPRRAIVPRLLSPLPTSLCVVAAKSGLGLVFSDFVIALANRLEFMSAEELSSLEFSFAQLLASCLAMGDDIAQGGGKAGRRAAFFRRVAFAIDNRLEDPALGPAEIAQVTGLAARTLQNLFAQFGTTMSRYILDRRLQRCRNDLQSPMMAQLSISEICYRNGFSDPAYFSRVFRKRYGQSPRDFRKNILKLDFRHIEIENNSSTRLHLV